MARQLVRDKVPEIRATKDNKTEETIKVALKIRFNFSFLQENEENFNPFIIILWSNENFSFLKTGFLYS